MDSELQAANDDSARESLKEVIICADDYGVDPNVDAAIVELAAQGRLSATSVLVDADISSESIDAIALLDIDVGLHLNFTEVFGQLSSQNVMPLSKLIIRAHARLLSRSWVKANIERQLDRFEALFGHVPDYVDGHLHVHQLPIIRDELIEALSRRQLPTGFWIRDTRAGAMSGWPWSERFKSWVIGHLGMSRLASLAARAQFSRNRGFFGVYDFARTHRPFMQMLDTWLSEAQAGALIMTHPARQVIANDPIGQARVAEYEGLASDGLLQLLQLRQARLVRASQTLSSLP